MLFAVCISYLSICVRKKEFIQPDGISVSLMKEEEGDTTETYALSSLWNSRLSSKVFVYRHSQRSMSIILLLLCGDIELYKIPGYVFIYRNPKHGLGGGVPMYIRESINWERRYDLENDGVEGIWIEAGVC